MVFLLCKTINKWTKMVYLTNSYLDIYKIQLVKKFAIDVTYKFLFYGFIYKNFMKTLLNLQNFGINSWINWLPSFVWSSQFGGPILFWWFKTLWSPVLLIVWPNSNLSYIRNASNLRLCNRSEFGTYFLCWFIIWYRIRWYISMPIVWSESNRFVAIPNRPTLDYI